MKKVVEAKMKKILGAMKPVEVEAIDIEEEEEEEEEAINVDTRTTCSVSASSSSSTIGPPSPTVVGPTSWQRTQLTLTLADAAVNSGHGTTDHESDVDIEV